MAAIGLTLAAMVQGRDDLTPTETLVGIVIALAVDGKTGTAWLKRETMQRRTRLSLGQLKRALAGLVGKGVVERIRTPRATVYRFPAADKKEGEMDGSLVAHRMAHGWTAGTGKPPRSIVPGFTGEQWEALREMMRDVGNERRIKGQEVAG
ncbi:hypothetical protein [Solidesulfovibrio sp.]